MRLACMFPPSCGNWLSVFPHGLVVKLDLNFANDSTAFAQKGRHERAAALPANSRADPHNKGAAMGGCGFTCELPCRPLKRKKRASLGGLRSYLRIPMPTLAEKNGQHGGAAASPVNLHVVPKTKKTRKKNKEKEKLTTKVPLPGQLLTLEEHAWRLLAMIKVGLGACCVSCSCLVRLGCSVCAGVVWLAGRSFRCFICRPW